MHRYLLGAFIFPCEESGQFSTSPVIDGVDDSIFPKVSRGKGSETPFTAASLESSVSKKGREQFSFEML
jgi:hypothetical protein